MFEITKEEKDIIIIELLQNRKWTELFNFMEGKIAKVLGDSGNKYVWFEKVVGYNDPGYDEIKHKINYLNEMEPTEGSYMVMDNVEKIIINGERLFLIFTEEQTPDIKITDIFNEDDLRKLFVFDEKIVRGDHDIPYYKSKNFWYTIQNLLSKEDNSVLARLIKFNRNYEQPDRTILLYKDSEYMFKSISVKLFENLLEKKKLLSSVVDIHNAIDFINLEKSKFTHEELNEYIEAYENAIKNVNKINKIN